MAHNMVMLLDVQGSLHLMPIMCYFSFVLIQRVTIYVKCIQIGCDPKHNFIYMIFINHQKTLKSEILVCTQYWYAKLCQCIGVAQICLSCYANLQQCFWQTQGYNDSKVCLSCQFCANVHKKICQCMPVLCSSARSSP